MQACVGYSFLRCVKTVPLKFGNYKLGFDIVNYNIQTEIPYPNRQKQQVFLCVGEGENSHLKLQNVAADPKASEENS